jgi:pimeloyl-ACP methyl ester carboxylesterase
MRTRGARAATHSTMLKAMGLACAWAVTTEADSMKTIPQTPELGAPEDMAFKADIDGSEQHYVRMLPVGLDTNKSCDVLIAFHGHGADRWQYVREARGECRGVRDAAARHGMIFVSPQYRGSSWMGPLAEADVVQLIGDLKRTFRVGRIILAGGSMGGTAVLTFTALHPELVDGVVSENGLANFAGYAPSNAGIDKAIWASFGGTEQASPAEYRKRSAELRPEAFAMPLAVTCGGKDTLVPPESVLRLAAAVQKHNRQVLVLHRPEGGHATDYEDTVQAVEFVLKAAIP